MASSSANVLGLDIGSATVGLAMVDQDGCLIGAGYEFHYGDPLGCARRLLGSVDLSSVGAVSAVSSTPKVIRAEARYDNRVAVVAGARRQHPELRSLLLVGAEKFGLYTFDANGRYQGQKTNSSCAAGTGSFLDQQARRLNLSGSAELSRLAMENNGPRPKIASRCAVFAKPIWFTASRPDIPWPDL